MAVGGVAGALARFAVGRWAAAPPAFPWSTLLVNVAGSILLGVLVRALPAWDASPELRALLTVGFCGSFTTFSTFGYETVALLQGGAAAQAAAYALGSVVLGLVGVLVGLRVGAFLV